MDWNKLKSNRCPKCGSDIEPVAPSPTLGYKVIACKKCDFFIRPQRMEELLAEMKSPNVLKHNDETNQEFLNNL